MNAAPPFPGSVQPQRCGLAIWSLVLGILALVLCVVCVGPLLGIPAVICGHVALSRIKRAAGTMSGHGPALGGLITGYISIALIPIIGLLAAIAIPNFVRARDIAQRNVCINHLRMIDSAKQQWALENAKSADSVPTPDELKPFLGTDTQVLICPKGGTYEINAVNEPPTCSIPGHELPR